MSSPLLQIRDLVIDYGKGAGRFRALHGCSFDLEPGQVMAV
ncbi:MAG TPA: peptide ABC transporter ATP-binding protein, partial [Oceanicaulis sp.]|nr:peptide ABC transporter ATP-binding protein [Oceanicaulis sp.]